MPNKITTAEPVTFRLPRPGTGGDPHFGISRSHYYALEKRGLLRLIRIRGVGKERGITLVPFKQVELLLSAKEEQDGGIEGTVREHASENLRSQNATLKGIQNKAS